ncbi:hypothetical protein [Vallitalea guaymasensis]|uniref:hypothetical protein n=1 Tax=Vallitalea guaymasensis TaxID=1185412 RepID=UPI000DE25174|nr:hypothetical protein [Vallitalea guaymasensis]
MFERLKLLFIQKKIDITSLDKAVENKWITKQQKQQIVNTQKDTRPYICKLLLYFYFISYRIKVNYD